MRCVVDTNVPVAANGGSDRGRRLTLECQQKAIEFLMEAREKAIILLDIEGCIQSEYLNHMNPSGQPGVGDIFLREVLNSHPSRIQRVELSRRIDGEYQDVPQALIDQGFDKSDRKFVAIAVKYKAFVANAVDSDWIEHGGVIAACGIHVLNLCGCDKNTWYLDD